MVTLAQASSALDSLAALLPDEAERVDADGSVVIVSPAELQRGDTVVVRPGARLPADGVIVEIHPEPEKAFCDGPQSLRPEEFYRLMEEVTLLENAMRNGLGRLQ